MTLIRFLTVLFFAVVSYVFADTTSILHLRSGESMECSLFSEKTRSFHHFLCNNDTIRPQEIKGFTDSSGYHPYIEGKFFSCKIRGNLSFYSADILEDELVTGGGFSSRAVTFIPVIKNKTYYTFDDSVYQEFHITHSNRPLTDALKLNSSAYLLYKRYQITTITSFIVICTSIIPLASGLFAIDNEKPGKSIGMFITAAAGISMSGIIRGVIGKRYFTRSIDLYNTN